MLIFSSKTNSFSKNFVLAVRSASTLVCRADTVLNFSSWLCRSNYTFSTPACLSKTNSPRQQSLSRTNQDRPSSSAKTLANRHSCSSVSVASCGKIGTVTYFRGLHLQSHPYESRATASGHPELAEPSCLRRTAHERRGTDLPLAFPDKPDHNIIGISGN